MRLRPPIPPGRPQVRRCRSPRPIATPPRRSPDPALGSRASSPAGTPPYDLTRRVLGRTALEHGWHLEHHHQVRLSRATIHRILTRAGAVTPDPGKRPRSSYLRFAAELPNECWQSDFTHYRLTRPDGSPGVDVEIITWLDDHSRYALSVTAHARITGPIVLASFRENVAQYGIPASTLTDIQSWWASPEASWRPAGRIGRCPVRNLATTACGSLLANVWCGSWPHGGAAAGTVTRAEESGSDPSDGHRHHGTGQV
ncbi:DDE-type integrase/transposase/recombinase [Kribbella sp. NPDC050124]|uniref:DDE-type integrase/transposase/recombinase n=1 Tax=Kribbella sp. NPDC050124 TaxID=3364114 RepID=UPI0037990F87